MWYIFPSVWFLFQAFKYDFYSFLCIVYLLYIVYYFFSLFLLCWFDQVSFHSLLPLLVFFFPCSFPVAFSVPAFIIMTQISLTIFDNETNNEELLVGYGSA